MRNELVSASQARGTVGETYQFSRTEDSLRFTQHGDLYADDGLSGAREPALQNWG